MSKGQIFFNKPVDEVLRDRRAQQQLSPDQEAARARMNAVKQGGRPLGGVPPVKIPPLGAEPLDGGGSMSAQAELFRDASSPLSPAYNPDLANMTKAGPFSPVEPEATKDPRFIPGMGSMIASNQPQLKDPRPVISDKTKADLETLNMLQKNPPAAKPSDEESAEAEEEKILAEGRKQIAEMKSYVGDDYQWNIHNNPTRKKEIESRLKDLDIVDIIQYGEIRQEITIVPDKMKLTLRSVSGEEDLAVKRMMFTENGGDRYMLDKFSLMNLACGVVAINNFELPSHMNDKNKFDESLFLKKFDTLMRFPAQFLADMGVQYMWFDERVRKLFVHQTATIKNS